MNNRKKILFFVPGSVGGAERMTVNIAKMLPPDQFEVHVAVVGKDARIMDFIPNNLETSHIIGQKRHSFIIVYILWKILCYKPDVVFSSSVLLSPRVIFASRLSHVKVIVRSSGMVGCYKKRDYYKVRLTYPWATKLIAQQEDMREEMSLMLHIPLDRIITLHNPLDSEVIDSKKNVQSPFGDNGTYNYVNVSRINKVKGHDVAIKALAEVRKSNPLAHLFFVGRYNQEDQYYQQLINLISSLNLKDFVHFVGYDENPYRWVAHADCFVFPSRHEGLPNALLEASYLGIPCVATRCLNIVREIIRDGYNGYTVEVDDVQSFADGMKKAIGLKDFKMLYQSATPTDFVNVFKEIADS